MTFSQDQIQVELSSYLTKRFLAKNLILDADEAFADLGIDSMTVVELVMYMEEKLEINIPSHQLTGDNLRSIAALAACAVANQAP